MRVERLRKIIGAMAVLALVGSGPDAVAVECTPLFTFTGSSASDRLGRGVAAAGDVNGDGFPDVIVGAPGEDNTGSTPGHVYVYSGQDGSLIWMLTGEAPGDAFGFRVSGAGDIDKDGYADLIVGARLNDNGGTDAGRAYIFSGKTGNLHWPPVTGEAAGDHFGASVDGAGDVDGDGFPDLIIGATYNGAGGPNAGRAYVYSGQTAGLIWVFTGEASDDRFGWAVAGAGDVNQDGRADLIVGAYDNDAGGSAAGRAYVYSGMNSELLWRITGDAAGDYLGESVSAAGDVNNDGFDDIIVGAQWNDAAGHDAGAAYMFYGPPTAFLTDRAASSAEWSMRGDGSNDEFGAVSAAGDVNNDGFADVVVGASTAGGVGYACVFHGGNFSLPRALSSANADWRCSGEPGDEYGNFVAGIGDINHNGTADVIVGAMHNDAGGPNAGRAYVYDLCNCPHQGDINGDAVIDVFDVIDVIGIAFSGGTDPKDLACPNTRGDVDNNGLTDVFDVIYLIATAFSGGPNPVDPCAH